MAGKRRAAVFTPAKRFLMTPKKRARFKGLKSSNAKQFHHLAELARTRLRLLSWFEAEKKRLGVDIMGEVPLAHEAGIDLKVKNLLKNRDRKIIGSILDVAGIKAKKKREIVVKAAEQTIEKWRFDSPETRVAIKFIIRELEKQKLLTKSERKAFTRGIWDWLESKLLFKTLETFSYEPPCQPQ